MLTIEDITEWIKQHGEDGGEVTLVHDDAGGIVMFNMWFDNEINKVVGVDMKAAGYYTLTVFELLLFTYDEASNTHVLKNVLDAAGRAELVPFILDDPGHGGWSAMMIKTIRPSTIEEFETDLKEFSVSVLVAHRRLHKEDKDE